MNNFENNNGLEGNIEKVEKDPMDIELPEGDAIHLRFTSKLDEYKKRFDKNETKSDYSVLKYKIIILGELLGTHRYVSFITLSTKLMSEDSKFNRSAFRDAFNVISDYVKTGGKNLGGGTGL